MGVTVVATEIMLQHTHTHTRDIHVTNSLHENETGNKQEIQGVRPRQAKENLWQGCRK